MKTEEKDILKVFCSNVLVVGFPCYQERLSLLFWIYSFNLSLLQFYSLSKSTVYMETILRRPIFHSFTYFYKSYHLS